jgi:flagellin-like hook-associated protein FlgL
MPVKKVIYIVVFSIILNQVVAVSGPLTYLNSILSNNEGDLDKSGKRLSEGTFLLPDNPANHAIYEKLEAHIRGLEAVIRNNGDLISYYQTAEGYFIEITDLIQNIRELLIKRCNTIYSMEDRGYIDAEINQYYDEILFTLKNAEFNKKKIFEELLKDNSIKQMLRDASHSQLDNVDSLLSFFLHQRAAYGAIMRTLELRNRGMAVSAENMSEFQGSLWYINMATEISRLKKYHLLFIVNLLMLRYEP